MALHRTPKVLLIGWDAADWKVIHPLMDAGLMPHLERLVNAGVMGNLATLDPPYSPMLWTSIATGKRPYKHGVLGFVEPLDRDPGVRPVMSTTRTCKAVWNILMQEGLKTHVVGWWPSHPAEPINGIAISDVFPRTNSRLYDPWPVADGSVHPAHSTDHFARLRIHPDELTLNHILPFVPNAQHAQGVMRAGIKSIARETAQAATLHAAFTNILRTQPWDFAALYQVSIDHYSHGFMRYHPPKRPHIPQPEFDMFHNVVTAGYRFHDMMLGRLLDLAGEDATVLLISDHGFQPDHLRPRTLPDEPAGPAYEHSPYGIFVMKGPGIKTDERLYGASLLDVTPTVLACFGLPVGEDMDGQVLVNAFEENPEPLTIPSWEARPGACGMHPPEVADDPDVATLALQQLVDLGYVEQPGGDVEENRKKAADEQAFNLARAYIDGGLLAEALPLLESLYRVNPDVARYAFQLAAVYQALGKLKLCRQVIDAMREKEFFNPPTLDVIEGGLLLGERRPIEAIKRFKKAQGQVNAFHARLNLQIARGFMMLSRWEDAEAALQEELALDPHHALAYELLGMVYLRDMRYAEAVDALLQAVGLEYESPNAHFQLGEALYNLGTYARAAEAFEVCLVMAPQANAARQKLVELYGTHLDAPTRAAHHAAQFDTRMQGTLVVVSGLPRSGTSMMMQLLERGGLDLFTDRKREADANNPRGYYEHEAVKTLPTNKKWIPQAEGKAVKVVVPLLMHLPPRYRYKVIFMERDLNEILASQRTMLRRLGKQTQTEAYPYALIQQWEQLLEKTRQWATRQPNVDILYVAHRDVIDHPFEQALRIHEFLEYQLLPERMVQAIDPTLHRERQKP